VAGAGISRWPAYGPPAYQHGVQSGFAFSLMTGATWVGAVDIYRSVNPVPQAFEVASIKLEMDTPERVEAFLASQPEPKQTDLRQLHARILADFPDCRLWFDDGTNESGKVVANPNIGYGMYTITYANGSTREFYRIGVSANTTGISVYVLGLDDKTYLARTYGASIGAASVTGYCIKFKRLSVINADALQAAIRYGMTADQNG
jgi:hypothetical protein